MSNQLLQKSKIVTDQLQNDIPDFKAGTIVAVHYKIKEGGKERVQIFKGIVIGRSGGVSIDATFTVLKDSTAGIKVERIFPLHSPMVEKIEILSTLNRGRRNKMYYLRKLKNAIKDANVKLMKKK